jgi:exocyst complex component 2
MAELERSVQDFYGIQSLYPDEWPTDKGNSDVSDDEDQDKERKAKLNRRKSRYQALERAATNRSANIPGSEKGNLVQRDEPDPLGTTDSVVMTLKRYGVPIQDDPKMRASCCIVCHAWNRSAYS